MQDWEERDRLRGSLIFTADSRSLNQELWEAALRPRLLELPAPLLARLAESISLAGESPLGPQIEALLASRQPAAAEPLTEEQWQELYTVLALVWVSGGEIDWRKLELAARRVALPTYPFQPPVLLAKERQTAAA